MTTTSAAEAKPVAWQVVNVREETVDFTRIEPRGAYACERDYDDHYPDGAPHIVIPLYASPPPDPLAARVKELEGALREVHGDLPLPGEWQERHAGGVSYRPTMTVSREERDARSERWRYARALLAGKE